MNILEIKSIGAMPQPIKEDTEFIELGDRPPRRATVYVNIPIVGSPPYRLARAGEGLVLKHWDGDDAPLYVVLRCKARYHRYDTHDIILDDAVGVTVHAKGWCPWGEAGNVGGEPEYLIQIDGTGTVYFAVRGEHDKITHYTYRDGEWLVESTPERIARLALEAAQSGKVEWI